VFAVVSINPYPGAATANYTRGPGPQQISTKLVLDQGSLPVQSSSQPNFPSIENLQYQALLYELQNSDGTPAQVVPNWFGVALPDGPLDLAFDVHVIIYFHPTPAQATYNDNDYFNPNKDPNDPSANADWKQLFGYIDRLGGQMAAANEYGATVNRLVIFPFLTQAPYTLATSQWGNVIHDILQDINNNPNLLPGVCTRPKNVIVASLSDGSVYLNRFLDESQQDDENGNPSIFSRIVEVWDFDSEISRPQTLVDPHGKQLRAYWQNAGAPSGADFVQLPPSSWVNFQRPPVEEVPPLPPKASNSVDSDDTDPTLIHHHYIRDTMFLDVLMKLPESDS